MARRWSWLLLGVAALAADAYAQDAQRSIAVRPPVQIWIDPALGRLQPIELHDVAIDIRVHGFLASTTLDLTFHNPNARVLEGELVLPLAAGQSVTGYALEVEGRLRQGVVVPKETARVAFEETVRRGIDPGLAELTRGNVFRTRLYPIPANGSKRIAIAFDQPLLDVGAAYRYVLPMQFTQTVKRFKVHAEAVRAEHAPTSTGGDGALGFERWRDSFVAELERSDFRPQRELAFDVPKPAAPVGVYAVPDPLEPAWRTFAAQVQSAPPAKSATAPAPRRIALYYDASGSAATRNRARELDVLGAWLAQLGDVEVDLVAFRNDADAPQRHAVRGGDSTALRAAIEALPLDGGSSYGAIVLDAARSADLVLIIGDGLSNFGGHEPQLAAPGTAAPRLVVMHAAQTVDAAALGRLARRHGGTLLNLLELDQAQALRQLGTPRWMLQSVRVARGECTGLVPAAPQPAGAAFSLYGRCRGPAEIALVFGDGTTRVARTVTLADAALLEPARGAFVERLWAVARIAAIEDTARPDEAAIVALAKRHGVVTRLTSMLVLDRIEDYVRYEVEPREPELVAQYRALLAAQVKQAQPDAAREQHLQQVLAQWQEFRAWHATRHPWLETVLQPLAETERARWQALANDPRGKIGRGAADAAAAEAGALQQRWLKDGADDATRAVWERDAVALLQRVEKLRAERLELAPDSDSASVATASDEPSSGGGLAGLARRMAAPMALPMVAPSAAEPPPPVPEPEAAEADLSVVEDAVLESVEVTGSRAVGGATAGADEAKKDGETAPAPVATEASIELAAWDPETPYLARLRAAKDPYAAYLRERTTQAFTPAFFLDCADFFRGPGKEPRLALRVLSNLAEIDFESAPLLRVLAYRLQQWERFELAVPLFEEALVLRGEEPQSRRDLALALSRQPQPDYARATALLWEVVGREWDGRFPEIQVIVLHELNDVLQRMPAPARATRIAELERAGVDRRFLEPIAVELRVVLTWDADNTDVDLWVIDPSGETAIYNHPRTTTGGHVSRDFTGGYGPEVFTIKRALPGTYVVKAHYYGDRQQKLTGAATVQAEFLTDFDSGASKRQAVTRRLEGDEDVIEIGRFTVGLD